ncbi:unnamed protein product [Lampetra planeri]
MTSERTKQLREGARRVRSRAREGVRDRVEAARRRPRGLVCTGLLVLGYVGFLLVGVAVFAAVEAPEEVRSRDLVQQHLAVFLRNNSCVDMDELLNIAALVVEARIYGVMGADGTISNLTNWDYNSAIFFAGTVVTTIGYGNLSPATVGGKVFCIIFATFGIPLNVVVLNKVGQVILRGLDWIAEVLRKKGLKKSSIRLLTTMAFVGLGFMIFVLFPAVIFMAVEGWSYTESYYFSFVTLSTIGFGDYVVGSNPSVHYTPLYKTMVAMWIIFGLAWLSAVFNAITALLERVGEDLARRDRRDLGSEGGIAIVDPGHPSHGDTTGDHGQMGEMGKEIHQVTNAGGETGGGSPIPGVSTEKGAIKDPGPGGGTEKDDLKDPGPGGDKEKDDLKDPGPGGGSEKEDLKDSGPGRDTEKGDLNASGPGGGVEKGDHGPEGGMENGGSVGSDTPDKPNLAEAQTERDDI